MRFPHKARGVTMNTVCIQVKDYEEILPELREVLERLSDDLIGDALLWI